MTDTQTPPPRRPLATWTGVGSWLYLFGVVLMAGLMHGAGDTTWYLTLLTFGPRWVVLVPGVLLGLIAVVIRRKALIPIVLGLVVGVGPVTGFCFPWRGALSTPPQALLTLRVVSVNVDRGTDLPLLFQMLDEVDPDVIAFQEGAFIAPVLAELKGKYKVSGTHDTFIATRYRIIERVNAPHGQGRKHPPAVRCNLETPAGIIHVHCLHLMTLRDGFEAVIRRRLQGRGELERVTAIRNQESDLVAKFAHEVDGPALVLGDFNMVGESSIFHRDWGNWQDAFAVQGLGLGATFFTRHVGLRIDHILADSMHWRIKSCRVGPDLHGQHRPLIAELDLLQAPEQQR
ncbi:MAG: endonuclease/exonuclease/phosphatase family protein [Planctomycetes bacterium]|nr:endonuclease/exonuclease/phosphatase family protein [Planctomycetota bacterium]